MIVKKKITVHEEIHCDYMFTPSMMKRIHKQNWISTERYKFVKRLDLEYTSRLIHDRNAFIEIKIKMTPEENTLYQLLPRIENE